MYRLLRNGWVAVFLVCWGNAAGSESEPGEGALNFAYATVLGTGAYQVGERSVYVLNLPFFATLQAPDEHQWGVELLLPLTLGVHDFDLPGFPRECAPVGSRRGEACLARTVCECAPGELGRR